MNVASLELCKTLHELSGWEDTYSVWWYQQVELANAFWTPRVAYETMKADSANTVDYPAYDLGYLLRKLPIDLEQADSYFYAQFFLERYSNQAWQAGYRIGASRPTIIKKADTPEGAACRLAVELFKRGILTKGEADE